MACYDAPLPTLPDNFDVLRIGKQEDFDWSVGLATFLNYMLAEEETQVLLLLEDYWLTAPVNWQSVDFARLWMQDDPSIAKFDLSNDRLKLDHRKLPLYTDPVVIQSAHGSQFQTSLQAAIWRTDMLYELLCAGETPWEFERHGTGRWINERSRGYLGGEIYGFDPPPMQYANAVGGAGGKPGVIEPKHMPPWMWNECVERGWAR